MDIISLQYTKTQNMETSLIESFIRDITFEQIYTFKKIHPKGYDPRWVLSISDEEQILPYMLNETKLNMNDYFEIQSVPTPRKEIITKLVDLGVQSIPQGQKMYRHEIITSYGEKKMEGMKRCLNRLGELWINELGGYRDAFDTPVLAVVTSSRLQFPRSDMVLVGDVLFLENGASVDQDFYNAYKGTDISNTITSLREIDLDWLVKCINNHQTIAIQTQALDYDQVDKFMKLFSNLHTKTIILKANPDAITGHPLYTVCEKIHNVIFVE